LCAGARTGGDELAQGIVLVVSPTQFSR
jgi:hypothetical protein